MREFFRQRWQLPVTLTGRWRGRFLVCCLRLRCWAACRFPGPWDKFRKRWEFATEWWCRWQGQREFVCWHGVFCGGREGRAGCEGGVWVREGIIVLDLRGGGRDI